MLDKFRTWYFRNYTEITWFLIGFLVAAGLYSLTQGHLADALFSFALAGVNYLFIRR
jgi:hypothetical protein